jgi:hypothetical protein
LRPKEEFITTDTTLRDTVPFPDLDDAPPFPFGTTND